jgi:hypothetical protein
MSSQSIIHEMDPKWADFASLAEEGSTKMFDALPSVLD